MVVSGLALGCDTAAHEGCVQSRGITVAVLAHRVDYVYLATNRKLASSIIDGSGALVSEYAPGTKPRSSYFVERDRVQSAFSLGVIIVETDVEGGTMHTAGFAVKQKRRLACLVHPPKFASAEKARGNQKLIKEADAFPLEKKEDLDAFIAYCFLERLRSRNSQLNLRTDQSSLRNNAIYSLAGNKCKFRAC